ncbi:MAG: hypothetical protein M3018_10730 [Actinomycetota bacterium]|nr:hypothetical protein [Actinomycetota bacterium]
MERRSHVIVPGFEPGAVLDAIEREGETAILRGPDDDGRARRRAGAATA